MRPGSAQMTTWVLLHSPLVGPMTGEPVAAELRRGGVETVVPDIGGAEVPGMAFWRYHAETVASALSSLETGRRVVVAGHSGAGPLLPAMAAALGRPVAGYLFVDAGLPAHGRRPMGDGAFADHLRDLYASGGRFPNWTDQALRDVVPDPEVRRRLVASQRPRPLEYWEEPIPVPSGWPDAPCAYLRFVPNPAYDDAAEDARRLAWLRLDIAGAHFHMLVAPPTVADAMRHLVSRLR